MSATPDRPAARLTEDELAMIERYCAAIPADERGYVDEEAIPALIAEVRRLRAVLAEYADRSRWEFVAFPLANGNVRLCATFDGGWGVAEAALATGGPRAAREER